MELNGDWKDEILCHNDLFWLILLIQLKAGISIEILQYGGIWMMNCILGFYVIIPQEEYALFFSQFNLKWFHKSLFMIWINLFFFLMDADLTMYLILPVYWHLELHWEIFSHVN